MQNELLVVIMQYQYRTALGGGHGARRLGGTTLETEFLPISDKKYYLNIINHKYHWDYQFCILTLNRHFMFF